MGEGGVCPAACWDAPPWADTTPCPVHAGIHTPLGRHPLSRHPRADTPRQTHTPLGRHPLPSACWDTHPLPSACWDTHPPTQCMLGYGQEAGGTHPTQMHSCLISPIWFIQF